METNKDVLFLALLLAPAVSNAASSRPECFEVRAGGTPAAILSDPTGLRDTPQETWCYETVTSGSARYQYLYNVDSGEVRPELAALVDLSESGRALSVTHGSLLHGQVSVHRLELESGFNPFPVPLRVEEARMAARAVAREFDFRVESSAEAVLKTFMSRSLPAYRVQIAPGTYESDVPAANLPWRGYWWNTGTLDGDSDSPLAKYDDLVKRMTGADPGTLAWERANHSSSDLSWSGHCNGWAASSVLYPEPTTPLWDAGSNRVIHTGDIKGWLAEASFCVKLAFYGKRYYKEGDDLNDIYPDLFHKVLVYYIDGLRKPVAHDYERDEEVDNHVITGYKFVVTAVDGEPGKFDVDATLRVHWYDKDYSPELYGEPNRYDRHYSYRLTTNSAGQIVGGEWTGGDNPDFLWVPLAEERCGWENPGIDTNMIQKIMTTLPPATPSQLSVTQ